MLANIVIGLGVSTGALALLDVFLSDSQKKWIENKEISLWNWLDDAKRLTFFEFASRHKRLVIWFSLLCVLSAKIFDTLIWIQIFIGGPPPTLYLVGAGIGWLGFLFTLWAGVKAIAWILRGTSVRSQLARLALFSPLALPTLTLLGSWISHYDVPPVIDSIMVLIAGITGVMAIFWLAVALLMLLVHVAIVILYVGEFIVRRITESDKGPILVVSAILMALAAVFKAGS